MTNIYFISQEWISDNLPMSLNVDPRSVFAHVDSAEKLFIQVILGSSFYEDLIARYSADTINQVYTGLTADEQILILDYIKPAEGYRALTLALPYLAMGVFEKGPQTQFDDYSSSVDLDQLKFLISATENRAKFYEERLNRYLCINGSKFPLYTTPDTNEVIKKNPRQGYNFGVGLY
jgi:hypothetical protein